MPIASVTIKLTDGTTLMVNGDGTTPAPSPDPTPTPSPDPTPTPTTQSGTSVVFNGHQWTLGGPHEAPGNFKLLQDGVDTAGGGIRYVVASSKLYVETVGFGWFVWNNVDWSPSINPTLNQPPAPVPAGATSKVNGPTVVSVVDDIWRVRVDSLPVHPQSAAIIQAVVPANPATGRRFHNDFGPENGIPYAVGHGYGPATVAITSTYADESDPGPYNIPLDAPIEAAGDSHLIFQDEALGKRYEIFGAARTGNGFSCQQITVWDLNRPYDQRELRKTSADAAGLSILAGLARVDEMKAALAQPNPADRHLGHALRFTLRDTGKAFVAPARHYASVTPYSLPSRPPMGMRIRVNPALDLSPFNPPTQVLLRTLQLYGGICADNGANFFFSGTQDPEWAQWWDDITSVTDAGKGFKSVAGVMFDDNIQILNFSDADLVLP